MSEDLRSNCAEVVEDKNAIYIYKNTVYVVLGLHNEGSIRSLSISLLCHCWSFFGCRSYMGLPVLPAYGR